MRNLRRRSSVRPTPTRVRLTLESLDPRCTPSSLSDPDGNDNEPELIVPAGNAPPQVINFMAVEGPGGFWEFTGDVVDEAPGGLTVALGGEPASLQGVTMTTDASGHFDKVIPLRTDGSDNGLASARTKDAAGQDSNVAVYNVSPG